ncbi:hypothetical protein LS482_03775 [Sinomicrobium kalidii]|uniref:hypothetical protein n=1 Tax=Sinomicrobium kalidii TaxID=2900738 RepID=UPI001E2DCA89|nr:hypothetical protein [Sinomicrobium kalidii]UGU16997.1 hypothetical protein LS482_03775 [Sinomicrobium kalidii]
MKKKKYKPGIRATYFMGFGSCLVLFILMSALAPATPDTAILGKWQEVSWEYEKLPGVQAASLGKAISHTAKNEITRDLVIHEAETWEFLPDGRLLLHNDKNRTKPMHWTLKSRGNILKLDHGEVAPEHYNLQVLNDDEMILYFNTDLQAKGIAKMKFKKIHHNNYAQKIQ